MVATEMVRELALNARIQTGVSSLVNTLTEPSSNPTKPSGNLVGKNVGRMF